jgi:hypothetical protein
VAVDDGLMNKARSLTNLTSNDDVINAALQEFIASSEDRKDTLAKFGKIKSWDPQFAGSNPGDYEKSIREAADDLCGIRGESFGIWKDRHDMDDPVAWVNKLRSKRRDLPGQCCW